MAVHDPGAERIHRKLEPVIGEPEATLLRDRLVTRDEIRAIVREELAVVEERLESRLAGQIGELRIELHRTTRNVVLSLTPIVLALNAVVFAALRFT